VPAKLSQRSTDSLRNCQPQIATPRSLNRKTRGLFVGRVAKAMDQDFMPWQQYVADVMGEELPNGLPAFREGIVSVNRQQGKSTLLLATEVERCTLRASSQTVAYTAQTGSDARKKLLNDQVPLLMASPLRATVENVHRAQGNEGVKFSNGSRIDVLASNASAGHGKIIDLGVIDEAFDDTDDRREQAMLPGMMTRPAAQLLVVSTMGTDASVYLNRKVELGRAAALEGRTSGIAYFEWAIPEGADIEDPASWWLGMPALGLTVSEASVAHARSTMTEGEFRRAFGNQRTRSMERAIPEVTWRLACRADVAPAGGLFGVFDVAPGRDWSAVAVAGGGVAELVEYRPGVNWLVGRMLELYESHRLTVAVDGRSPAASLIPDLRAAGVPVRELTSSEITAACGTFYDDLADGKVKVRLTSPELNAALDAAVVAVTRQPVVDTWKWGRKGSVDISPLIAVTLAAALARSSTSVYESRDVVVLG
jgi:hypothetical protein